MTDQRWIAKSQVDSGTVYAIEWENRALVLARARSEPDVGTVQNGHDIVGESTCQVVAGYKLKRR